MNESCDIVVLAADTARCRTCGATWAPEDGEESPCEAKAYDALSLAAFLGLAIVAIAIVWFAILFLRLLGSVVVDIGTGAIALLSHGWGG